MADKDIAVATDEDHVMWSSSSQSEKLIAFRIVAEKLKKSTGRFWKYLFGRQLQNGHYKFLFSQLPEGDAEVRAQECIQFGGQQMEGGEGGILGWVGVRD